MSKEKQNELLINNVESNNSEVISNKQIDLYHIEDLLVDFDEMGFVPTTACPDPNAYAIEWKDKLTNAWEDYRKQEWISVDERLPSESGKYLVATERGTIVISRFYTADGGLFSFRNLCNVTHWMPLPEPPMMKGE